MANTYIDYIEKKDGSIILPRTVAEAVNDNDGHTLQEDLNSINDTLDSINNSIDSMGNIVTYDASYVIDDSYRIPVSYAIKDYIDASYNTAYNSVVNYMVDGLDKKVDKVTGKGLSTNDYTTNEKNKLAGIESGAEVNVQSDWNATSGDAFIKNKPVIPDVSAFAYAYVVEDNINSSYSSLYNTMTSELDKKVDKVDGKGLSTNDYTTDEKNKLAEIESGAEVNVQANWIVSDPGDDAYILNKPIIPDVSAFAYAYVVEDNISSSYSSLYNTMTSELDKKVDKVSGKGLSTNDYTTDEKNKLAGIAAGAEVNVQSDWNATSGDAFIKNKPVIPDVSAFAYSSDVNEALNTKVDKVSGKGLSTNDYTTDEKSKLAGIASGADVNVQSDWNATSGDAFIKNKPDISVLATTSYVTIELATKVDKVTGKGLSTNDYTTNEKNKLAGIASGAEVNVQSDWNATSGDAYILNKPVIPDVSAFAYSSNVNEALNTKVDKVSGKGLSTNDYTTNEKNKLAGIASGAEVNVQSDWNATSGDAYILNKPVIPDVSAFAYAYVVEDNISSSYSSLYNTMASELDKKVDKVSGKGLSTNDYTTTEKNKLAGIASGAEVNVQANWIVSDPGDDAYILNKPVIPDVSAFAYAYVVEDNISSSYSSLYDTMTSELDKKVDKVSGKGLSTNDYTTTEKNKLAGIASGAEANVQSDWNATSGDAFIKNKPDISVLATTSYVTTELNKKVDKVSGKGLSTEDFTTALKDKLDRISEGSVNQRADWNEANPNSYSYILNKPVISTGEDSAAAYKVASDMDDENGLPTASVIKDYVDTSYETLYGGVVSAINASYDTTVTAVLAYLDEVTIGLRSYTYTENKTLHDDVWTYVNDTYNNIVTYIGSYVGTSYNIAYNSIVNYIDDELDKKVDKISGKGLSTNDYTTTEKNKLAGIASGAEANVQANWIVSDPGDDAYILNKPIIPDVSAFAYSSDVNEALALKVDKISGKGLSTNDYTTTEKNKLAGIEAGATNVTTDTVSGWGYTKNTGTITGIKMNGASKGTSGVVDLGTVITAHQDISGKADKTTTVNGHALSGNVSVTKSDVGLGSVVNTGDSATPVSGGTTKFTTGGAYTELAKKVDKVDGKGLSTNDYTTDEKSKLAGIEAGAEVNVQSDWNATSGDAFIKNKPDLSVLATISYVVSEDNRHEDEIMSYVTTELNKKADMSYVVSYIPDYSLVTIDSDINNISCPAYIDNYQQCHVIYKNISSEPHQVIISTSYTTPDNGELKIDIPAGGYGEINFFKIGDEVFVRAV